MGKVICFTGYKLKKEMRLAALSEPPCDLDGGIKMIFDAMNISPEDLALIRGKKNYSTNTEKKQ